MLLLPHISYAAFCLKKNASPFSGDVLYPSTRATRNQAGANLRRSPAGSFDALFECSYFRAVRTRFALLPRLLAASRVPALQADLCGMRLLHVLRGLLLISFAAPVHLGPELCF